MKQIYLPLPPQRKPRMTQRDRWNPSKAAQDYWQWKDKLNILWSTLETPPPTTLHLVFLFGMPKSWSKKKKREKLWQPHDQTPDTDNCIKAFLDALMEQDKEVWDVRGTKLWSNKPGILLRPLEPFELEDHIKEKIGCESTN